MSRLALAPCVVFSVSVFGLSAKRVLRQAYKEAGFISDVVVLDEYNAYPRAIKRVFGRGKVKHAQAHFKQDVVKQQPYIRIIFSSERTFPSI